MPAKPQPTRPKRSSSGTPHTGATVDPRVPWVLLFLGVCLTISGAASLALEIVWLRELRLVFGSTTLAASTILVAYMLGLGAGAWLGGLIATRIARPIQAYGTLEITVGMFAVFVPWLCRSFLPQIAVWLVDANFWLGSLVKFLVSLLVLIVPTVAMGATLPLVAAAAARTVREAGQTAALLYGANTFGAVMGVFGTTFILLPWLGSSSTNSVAAFVDVVLGSIVIVWDRFANASHPLAEERVAVRRAATAASESSRQEERPVWVPLTAYAVVGFTALAHEVCWTRALASVFGSSTYAFGSMLGSFLIGIALGSFAMRRIVDQLRATAFVAAVLILVLSGTVLFTFKILFLLPEWFPWVFVFFGATYEAAMGASVLLTLVALLPPTVVLGALFPTLVATVAKVAGTAARSVGRTYFWNTLGSSLGAFLSGFLLLPALGLEGSLRTLATGTALTSAALALWQRERTGLERTMLSLLAASLAVAVWTIGPRVQPEALARGVFRFPLSEIDVGVAPVGLRGPVEGQVLYYRDGWNATVSVHRVLGELSLRVNGKADASSRGDLPTQVLLGHLGYFFRPDAKDVAIVGLASGITAGSATLYGAERIEVIEIEPAMVEASQFFHHLNRRPLEHPSVRLVIEDARTYLLGKKDAYDLVVSEPSNPWMSGSANLFTRDFFSIARRALRPRGLLVQWLQLYAMPEESVAAVLSALSEVFPFVYGFAPGHGDTDLLLIASQEPIRARDFPEWEDLPLVARTDLARAGIFDGEDLRALLYLTAPAIQGIAARAPVTNTDDNMFVELAGPRAMYLPPTGPGNWQRIDEYADNVASFWLDAGPALPTDRLAELAMAYLRREAVAVARSLAEQVRTRANEPLVAAVQAQLKFKAEELSSSGLDSLVAELERVLSRASESYSARYLLATAEHDRQQHGRALAQLEEGLQRRPGDLRLKRLRLQVLLALGRFTEAYTEASELLLTPLSERDRELLLDAARAAAQTGHLTEAIQLTERYLDFSPDSPEQWAQLAEMHLKLGQHTLAAEARTKADQAKRNLILSLHRQARQMALVGDLEGAMTQLRNVLLFDPSYRAARQDLEHLQRGERLVF